MKVEFEKFTVSEDSEGRLSVTAKNGFTVRLSQANAFVPGIHINGPKYGEGMEVWTTGKKPVFQGKKTLVSVYKIPLKVKSA